MRGDVGALERQRTADARLDRASERVRRGIEKRAKKRGRAAPVRIVVARAQPIPGPRIAQAGWALRKFDTEGERQRLGVPQLCAGLSTYALEGAAPATATATATATPLFHVAEAGDLALLVAPRRPEAVHIGTLINALETVRPLSPALCVTHSAPIRLLIASAFTAAPLPFPLFNAPAETSRAVYAMAVRVYQGPLVLALWGAAAPIQVASHATLGLSNTEFAALQEQAARMLALTVEERY
jgi:hypothetical protein